MNPKEYDGLIKGSLKRRIALAKRKRHDYANNEDVLANFKRLGEAVRVLRINKLWDTHPALAYALFMEVMKIDRLINLTVGKKLPKNESMVDTWDDLKNYADLAEAVFVDAQREEG